MLKSIYRSLTTWRRAIPRETIVFPALVFLSMLALTFGSYTLVSRMEAYSVRVEARESALMYYDRIEDNLHTHMRLLQDLRGLFASSDDVSREEFEGYLRQINLDAEFPGVHRISYAPYVPARDRARHEAVVRQEGFPNYRIQAPGPLEAYFPLLYLYPFNERAKELLGQDRLSKPELLKPLLRARDRDIAAVTGYIELGSRPGEKAFRIVLPVYRKNLPTDSIAQRRQALSGFLVATMVVDDVLNYAVGRNFSEDFSLTVHGGERGDGPLLHASALGHTPQVANLIQTIPLKVADQTWTVTFTPSPAFLAGKRSPWPFTVLLAGIVTTLLLTYIAWQASARTRERKAREAETLRVKQLLDTVVENIPSAIFVKEASDLSYILLNRAGAKLIGCTQEDVLGKTDQELFPPHEAALYRNADREALSYGKILEIPIEPVHTLHQGVRCVRTRKVPIINQAGEPQYVLGIADDITQQMLAQERLRKSETAFRTLFEQASVGIAQRDLEGRYVLVNRKYEEILGYTAAEMLTLRFGDLVHPEDHIPLLNEYRRMQKGEAGGFSRHQRFVRKDGATVLANLSVTALLDNEGKPGSYIEVVEDITEQKRKESIIHHLAHHDPLTGLPNRKLLHDRLHGAVQEAARQNSQVAIMFMDLNRFKIINDSLGHDLGDKLLKEMAQRLSDVAGPDNTVARLGGDEFVIVLEGVENRLVLADKALQILEAISQPVNLSTYTVDVSSSIGISLFPSDTRDPALLLKYADLAMYQAKRQNEGFRFYDDQMNKRALESLLIENGLRRALERGELVVHYQPRINLHTGVTERFEALVRWQHPERGLLFPTDFITVAEDCGLINQIGEYVLRRVCAQIQHWQDVRHLPVRVSINLSARQLKAPGLVAAVRQILSEHAIDASSLEFELTESCIMSDIDHALRVLRELRESGICLSIDDFGTGYSSLSYLRSLPIYALKIDKSFILDIDTDPEDATLVTSIIAMAHNLGLEVVAEGVQSVAQLAFLRAQGCNQGQGFLFSKALDPAEVPVWLMQDTMRDFGAATYEPQARPVVTATTPYCEKSAS